jgi:type II secretory pathway predicted ATPase ExeA
MELNHYGLNEQPFGVTPDPRYLYLSTTHREALASLLYAIDTQRGFSALVASPGMGKTCLLFKMLESLGDTARTAFIFKTDCNWQHFFVALMKDLGVPFSSRTETAQAHEALNDMLLHERQAGRRVVVVVDEAQNLSNSVLESIRLLSNFETTSEKLMHIVLAGQPQLAEKLAEPELLQLRQRISSIIRLQPLSAEESKLYIRHRLRHGGYPGTSLFTPEAETLAVQAAKGIPRNLNNVCFQALSLGFAMQTSIITAPIMEEVLRDLKDSEPKAFQAPARKTAASRPPRTSQPAANSPQGNRVQANQGRGFLPRAESASSQTAAAPRSFPAMESFASYGRGDERDFYGTAQRPSHWKRNLGILTIAALGLATFLYLRQNDVVAGRLSDKAADAVSTSTSSKPSPASTDGSETAEQSKPKASAAAPDSSGATGATDNAAATKPSTPSTIDTEKVDSAERSPSAVQPTSRPDEPERMAQRTPEYIRIDRPQTLFQVALEQYGKSNWYLVSRIRAMNPNLRSPYDIVPTGTQIRLPNIANEDGNASPDAQRSKTQKNRR